MTAQLLSVPLMDLISRIIWKVFVKMYTNRVRTPEQVLEKVLKTLMTVCCSCLQ